ncbi:MAG: RND transporter, partial [Desulfovibrionales bacterium]|nr:RND transporter [Desulfovibrionales bacterium]
IMQGKTLSLLDREIETNRRLFAEAERHYSRGLESYLPVVSALMGTQELEITRVRRRAAYFKYRIGLYRSLGGAWTQDIPGRGK